jgi:membrane protein required for colicin V production
VFDLIVLVVLIVSGLIGWARGATREILTVLAFLFAAMIAVGTLGLSGALARHTIHPEWLANGVALIVVFTIAYVGLRIAGGILAQKVKTHEHLGVVDRSVGVGFGVVRALVLLGAFNIVLNLATPADRMPHWISGAVLYPLTNVCAKVLKAFAPQGKAVAGKVAPAIENAVRGKTDGADDGKAVEKAAEPTGAAPKTAKPPAAKAPTVKSGAAKSGAAGHKVEKSQ